MMESSELRRKIKQNRRKERAEKVEKERSGNDGDDDNAGPPIKKPRRKPRKLVAEEDIVDGFAILAFKNYDDLTRSIKSAEEDSNHKKSCVEVLKRSQDGTDNKVLEKHKKVKKPKPNAALNQPLKISDGCSDLFAPSRKDSSPKLPDNLHSSNEERGIDIPRHQNHCESSPPTPTSSVISYGEVKVPPQKLEASEFSAVKPLHKNGKLGSTSDKKVEDLNGHVPIRSPQNVARNTPVAEKALFQPHKNIGPQTLFTPYAASAITRVGTPNTSNINQSATSESYTESPSPTPPSFINSLYARQNSSGGHSFISNSYKPEPLVATARNQSTPSVAPEKSASKVPKSSSPGPTSSVLNRKVTSIGAPATTPSNKSNPFGSIARLLDTPSTSRSSPVITSSSSSTIYSHSNQSVGSFITNGGGHPNAQFSQSASHACNSRSHSPRGHSPSRERDSYSSNVSSLSRTSGTPVSGTNQLPPTISPLQNLQSYSKAASWLNTVRGLSPVPRPTPPPPSLSAGSSAGSALGSGAGQLQIARASPLSISGAGSHSIPSSAPPTSHSHSVFPGLGQGPNHSTSLPPPPNSAAAMFAPPILPLSSIAPHQSTHPSYGTTDALFPGSTASSELVRRDLESRGFLPSDRSLPNATSNYMSRPNDLHHHPLLPPLTGVGHLPQQSPGGQTPTSHSAMFPPPLFKDNSYYRSNLTMAYPGFNGILPPNLATTPFAPPSQIAAFTPKIADPCKPARVMKSGKWNAMHVRIAWEIYQDQQKGGTSDNKNRNPSSSPAKMSLGSSNVNLSAAGTQTSTSSGVNVSADLLRAPQHVFSGMNRPPEVGSAPPQFSSPLLASHPGSSSSHRHSFDASIFLNSSGSLGPPMPRYPGFPPMGPSYGGLGGLGSSLLSREQLSNLAALGSHQDPWNRNHRGPPFPSISQLNPGWPIQRPDRDTKTPIDSRRHKEDRIDKRIESHSDTGRRSRDLSPFRDRSPVRPVRTPLENGDNDSRSSRSNDSHSAVHLSSKSGIRSKEESNGDMDRTLTPFTDRDKLLQQLQSDSKHQSLIPTSHPSRLFHPGSPMTVPTSVWDSFSPLGPRIPGADSFRLSLLHLSERDRELQRLQHSAMRPPLYANGPFGNLQLGLSHQSAASITKGNPGGSMTMPLLNPAISAVAAHNHLLHSSLNGPNSPKIDGLNPMSMRAKEDSQSR